MLAKAWASRCARREECDIVEGLFVVWFVDVVGYVYFLVADVKTED